MKAYYNKDYQIYVDKDDLRNLTSGKLEAELQDETTGKLLGKKFILSVDKRLKCSEASYIPPLVPGFDWENLRQINFTMNLEDYELFRDIALAFYFLQDGRGINVHLE